ncbi:MAG: hypothetical protein ACYC3I_13460 [Gemmataceae bacterium]
MWSPKPDHPLRRMFAGLTEHTFVNTLGVADPRLTDYLSELLSRFIHMDAVHRLCNAHGKRLEEVAEMMIEAEAMPPQGRTRREIYRHIGDFTLFWTGVYPEALKRLRSILSKDHFLDYCAQGKRSYYIASTFDEPPYEEEAPVLRRLSEDFELCAYGLHEIRCQLEHPRGENLPPGSPVIN